MSINYNGTNIESILYNGTDLTKVTYNNVVVWEKQQPTPTNVPLTLTAVEDTTIKIMKYVQDTRLPTIKYSTNGVSWSTYTYGTDIRLNAGKSVQFWNDSTTDFSSGNLDYGQFVFGSGKVAASGNCNSLINYSSTAVNYCFYSLFRDCTSLVSAPILPATNLWIYCYAFMFCGCSNLIQAPEIPATIATNHCCHQMFDGCTSLVSAPSILPAATVYEYSYYKMFNNCTSLITAPELPATTLNDYCYFYMFSGCTSLTTAPSLPAVDLNFNQHVYSDMFSGCTSLTTVPKLPATVIRYACYNYMFSGCTSLIVSDTQTSEAAYEWNIPDSETFIINRVQYCMFSGCAGTRASNDMPGQAGQSYTYYTQNPPV